MHCRVCNNTISEFMTLGKMPIANNFIEKKDLDKEYFFELLPAFCEKCYSFQIIEQPDPSMMFHENYAFFSQTSKNMILHFKKLSEKIKNNFFTSDNPFIVELGSNDGIFLKNFLNYKCNHLGVEPSKNVAEAALQNNVNSIVEYFSSNLAKKIVNKYGKADVVTSANVMCHIPNINDVALGISELLNENGVLIFEDPYLGSVIEKISYDQIYDEHVFLFSIYSVEAIFSKFGLHLFDVEFLQTHGGSMRYYLSKRKDTPISKNLLLSKENEKKLKLNQIETYIKFSENVKNSKSKLIEILDEIKNRNKLIYGYAATSKSTTVLNYCNIGTDYIEGIFDTTPIKQKKFSPGKHIPILEYKKFNSYDFDFLYNFAWNHSTEIYENEKEFYNRGGKWISHVPIPKII